MSVQRLQVPLERDAYPILVGAGLLAESGDAIRRELSLRDAHDVFVIADSALAKTALPILEASLRAASLTPGAALTLPAGEETKSLQSYERVVTHLLTCRIKRDSVVVALGGGVIGDLAGFAAATVLRGVRLVQIPTTLLAQVDSSVGGKTGINTAQGKNLLGSFHQPSLVLIDTETLTTLPEREVRAGYAEILKYALIADAGFFGWLQDNGVGVIKGDSAARVEAILKSCAAKALVVAADPYEKDGRRALLNLGHTFGHALEALGGYDGRLLHGEAVAIGMHWAMAYSVQKGLCPAADLEKLTAHMTATGLPRTPPFPVTAPDVVRYMMGDKKNASGDGVTLILQRGIGEAFVAPGNSGGDITAFLQTLLAGE